MLSSETKFIHSNKLLFLSHSLFFSNINISSQEKKIKKNEPESWRAVITNSIKESMKAMILRTSTWTVLMYLLLLLTFSGKYGLIKTVIKQLTNFRF